MSTEVATTRGRPRKLRPNGQTYSSDPKVRYQELVEDGKIGPEFGKLGGRPRKKRAAEIVAEHARKKADEIIRVFDAALEEDMPIRVRMEAAQALIKIERDEDQLQLEEDKFEEMSRDELVAGLRDVLGDPQISSTLGVEYVDAEFEEVAEAEVVS